MRPIYVTAGMVLVTILFLLILTVMLGGMFYQPTIEEFDDE